MNDRTMTDDRDDEVARAIRAMPVPDHSPDFWDRLERSLAAEPSPAASRPATRVMGEAHDPREDLAPLLGSLEPPDFAARRRDHEMRSRRVRWTLAAAAAVLTIGVIGAQALGGDDDSSTVQQGVPTTTPGTVAASTTTPGGATPSEAARAQQTLLAFVDALAEGRTADAAALLAPRSETYLAAQSGSVAAFLVQASEGVGSWGGSTDRRIFSVELASRAMVVVLDGTIAPEGMPEHRTQAFAMTKAESADTWLVDAWAFDPAVGGRLEVSTTPDAGGVHTLSAGAPFQAFVSAAGAVRFSLEGSGPVDVAAQRGASGWAATWTPSALVRGEERILTIAFEASDASIFTSIALRVRVA